MDIKNLKIKEKNFNNSEYVLITGASSGIGYAFAIQVANAKKNLILIALENSGLADVTEEIKNKYKIDVIYFEIDLSDQEAYYKIFEYCSKKNIYIDTLINNVGIGNDGRFDMSDKNEINLMIQLNVSAMVNMTYLFLDQLKSDESDKFILNVSSMAALIPVPYKSIYSATKIFVYSFSRTLSIELESRNVHLSCLCPGPVATNIEILNRIKKMGWKAKLFILSADDVAKTGWNKMLQKKFLIIPGWKNRLLRIFALFIPHFIRNIVFRLIYKRFKYLPLELTDKNIEEVETVDTYV